MSQATTTLCPRPQLHNFNFLKGRTCMSNWQFESGYYPSGIYLLHKVWNMFKINNKDVVLVSFLLTLNIFHTWFYCFLCLLRTCSCRNKTSLVLLILWDLWILKVFARRRGHRSKNISNITEALFPYHCLTSVFITETETQIFSQNVGCFEGAKLKLKFTRVL